MPRELVAIARGEPAFREYHEPALGGDEVRISSEFASPKHGTESHQFLSESTNLETYFDPEYRLDLPREERISAFPMRIGNMTVGRIVEAGPSVTRFKVGDRVYGHLPIRETHTVHELGRNKGKVGFGSGVRESRLHHLPPSMSSQEAVLLDPAHFALAAVRDAKIGVGDWVAVYGLGAIGLLIVQMARLNGAERVFALDPLENRRSLALSFGADLALDPSTCDVGFKIKQVTGKKGVDVAIDASGSYRALQSAIRSVHYCGTVVTCSLYHRSEALRLDQDFFRACITLKVSMPVWGNPNRNYPAWDDERLEETVYRLMLAKKLNISGLIHPIVPFEQAAETYKLISKRPEEGVKLGVAFGHGRHEL